VSGLFHALRRSESKKLLYVERKINKCATVIALLPMVRRKGYFREHFGCHIAPIKRSWDIVVGIERDCYVSYISVRLILTIWNKEKCSIMARQKDIMYICI
jgi:hypothetical protein